MLNEHFDGHLQSLDGRRSLKFNRRSANGDNRYYKHVRLVTGRSSRKNITQRVENKYGIVDCSRDSSVVNVSSFRIARNRNDRDTCDVNRQ